MLTDRKKLYLRSTAKAISEPIKIKLETAAADIQAFLDSPTEKSLQFNADKCEMYGLYFHNGKYQTLNKWSSDLGIPYATLHKRIFKYGFSFGEAIIKMTAREAHNDLVRRFPDVYMHGHTPAFLEKQEKAKTEKEQAKNNRIAKRAANDQYLKELLSEFNSIGWTEFMKKYGEKRGRILFSRIKFHFGSECMTKKQNKAVLIQYRGKTQSISKWERELGISPWSVYPLIH